jgi:predicted nucleotidyltransferase
MTVEIMKLQSVLKINTLKNNIDIDPVIGEMLLVIEKVLKSLEINFYVVGAIARDLQLAKGLRSAGLRKRNDVDLAIMMALRKNFIR